MAMMTVNREDIAEILTRDYGIELILLQNDITEETAVGLLIEAGLVDPNDYLYQDVSQQELDLED